MSGEIITHDATRRRYSLVIEGAEAYLTYDRTPIDTVHITHTIVPDQLGGRGFGKRLVAQAVEDAIAAGDRIASSCWFATALIEKKPVWAAQMA
jgi:hypothetical protein